MAFGGTDSFKDLREARDRSFPETRMLHTCVCPVSGSGGGFTTLRDFFLQVFEEYEKPKGGQKYD